MRNNLQMTLIDAKEWTSTSDGKAHRHERWKISGGDIAPEWRRPGREPWCEFTLYVRDDEVDVWLASYGGEVWPTAWPELFQAGRGAAVKITDTGLVYRAAALYGAPT